MEADQAREKTRKVFREQDEILFEVELEHMVKYFYHVEDNRRLEVWIKPNGMIVFKDAHSVAEINSCFAFLMSHLVRFKKQ